MPVILITIASASTKMKQETVLLRIVAFDTHLLIAASGLPSFFLNVQMGVPSIMHPLPPSLDSHSMCSLLLLINSLVKFSSQ